MLKILKTNTKSYAEDTKNQILKITKIIYYYYCIINTDKYSIADRLPL